MQEARRTRSHIPTSLAKPLQAVRHLASSSRPRSRALAVASEERDSQVTKAQDSQVATRAQDSEAAATRTVEWAGVCCKTSTQGSSI